MDLHKWMKKAKIGQRELARRVGYSSNGMVSKILTGKAYVPMDDVPKWAAALGLSDAETSVFTEECSKESIPDWILSDLKALRSANRKLVDLVAHRSEDPLPLPRDRAMDADQRLAEITNLRKINRALLDQLEIAEGLAKRKKLAGVDHIPEPDA